ncbi:hypothetical protein SAMN02990966_02963 [Rhodospirillales bacterium URHD0017]|nr:hypothetical protein SAMN02990966_02963 [Rhodospirillales bacterium URHD0017]
MLSFKGEMRRLPYALAAFALFFSQHLALLAFCEQGRTPALDYDFYLVPVHSFRTLYDASSPLLVLTFVYLLIVAWALAALSFRRAANADVNGWIAAAAIAPVIQVPVILFLCIVPPRTPTRAEQTGAPPTIAWAAAAQGVVVAIALTLIFVGLGALVFGIYGFGMFVASPFIIGAVTGYIANRRHAVTIEWTITVVLLATTIGGMALIAAALEGIVCIMLAAPLGFGVAVVGGLLGRAIALRFGPSTRQTMSAVALVPLILVSEWLMPTTTRFDTRQSIEINAPPSVVWQSIVRMDMRDEPVALPYRLGLAYPLGGEVVGEGVGALRRGEFSTGTALERVTEWLPDRKLAFVVEKDVPALRELSPYDHVHAPHVRGYFLTNLTSFELVPLPGNRTQLVERTSHELKLEPILYWMPLARLVIDLNNDRVLRHIKRRAEK